MEASRVSQVSLAYWGAKFLGGLEGLSNDGLVGDCHVGNFVFIEFGHDGGELIGDVTAHFGDEFDTGLGDADHDLATVFGSVDTFDETKLFKTINQTGSGSS